MEAVLAAFDSVHEFFLHKEARQYKPETIITLVNKTPFSVFDSSQSFSLCTMEVVAHAKPHLVDKFLGARVLLFAGDYIRFMPSDGIKLCMKYAVTRLKNPKQDLVGALAAIKCLNR